MQIKEMFEKPIDRNIKGVIKVGQKDEENIYQELNEYVVTDELKKHFSEFFDIYSKGVTTPTDDIGVWISGFFGSGKSHFLKILSYILDSELKVKSKDNPGQIRRPIDFFKEDNKIQDPIVIANMIRSSDISTDVILFNIDSKSSNSESEKDKILDVFVKVFNEMRGYCTEYPFLAEFEKKLDENGKLNEFKSTFKEINGDEWEIVRDDYFFISDDIVDAIVTIPKKRTLYNLFDSGAVEMSIMAAAKEHGIDSVPAYEAIKYPDILRKHMKISEDEDIVIGIALGFEDKDHIFTKIKAKKLTLEEACHFYD